MKRFSGLDTLCATHRGLLNPKGLAALLMDDLRDCQCYIYGCIGDDEQILLSTLSLLPETVLYEMFDQRIDFTVAGPILRNDCVPLTYRLQGSVFAITGRCSMIARVCGVDLYLQKSYTGQIGDIARQKFSLDIKVLLKLYQSA